MYAYPPWPLMPRLLAKTTLDRAKLVVCLPVWMGAPWWPAAMALRTSALLLLPDNPPRPLGLNSGPLPLENLYDGHSGLTTSLTQVEAMTDIPLQERITHLLALAELHPSQSMRILNTVKRLKHASSKAKYDMFFDVTPWCDYAQLVIPRP